MLGRYPIEADGEVTAVAVSPDSRIAAIATKVVFEDAPSAITLCDLASGEHVATIASGVVAQAIAFTPDGKSVVAGEASGALEAFAISDGSRRGLGAHAKSVTSIAVSGKLAVSAGLDGCVRVTDLETGALVREDKLDARAVAVIGESYVAGCEDGVVRIVALATGKELGRLEGHEMPVRAVAATPDGRRVFSAGISIDSTVRCWDVATRKQLWSVKTKDGEPHALAVSPDGKSLLVGSWGLHLLDIESGTASVALQSWNGFDAVGIAPDGKRAIAAGKACPAALYDLEAGAPVRALAGHEDEIVGFALARDGKRAVTASHDGTVKCWDVEAGKVAGTFRWNGDVPNSIAISPSGRYAVAGRVVTPEMCGNGAKGPSPEETLLFLDLEKMTPIEPAEEYKGAVSAVAFSPDGKLAASAGAELVVWETATAKRVRVTSTGLKQNRTSVEFTSVAFSVDGKEVSFGDELGRLYGVPIEEVLPEQDPKHSHGLGGMSSSVVAIGSSRNGSHTLAAFAEGKVFVMDRNTAKSIDAGAGDDDQTLTAAALSFDGRTLATSTAFGIRLWDRASGVKLDEIPLAKSRDAATSLAFGLDGKTLFAATKLGVVLRFAIDERK